MTPPQTGYYLPPANPPTSAREELSNQRPRAGGKFFYVSGEKLWVKGITYGTFALDAEGHETHFPDIVKRDFGLMATQGINAIRTYTVPPKWVLDLALHYGLRVFVGIPWE